MYYFWLFSFGMQLICSERFGIYNIFLGSIAWRLGYQVFPVNFWHLCCAFLLVYGLGAAAFSLVFGMRGATFSLVYAIRAAAFSLVYASVPLHSYWYVAWVLYCCLLIGLCHKGCRLLIGQLHPEYVALSLNVKNGISRLTDRIRWIRTEETW